MAKSVRGGDAAEINLGGSASVTWPASVSANDIAYVFVSFYQTNNASPNTPSNFSSLLAETGIDAGGGTGAGTSCIAAFYKQCAGDESGELTVSFSGSSVYANILLVVMAGDGDLTHASVGSVTTAQSTTDSTAPSVSATAGQLLMAFYGISDPPGTTNAAPSGMTLAQDGVNTTNSARIYWQSISSTGATGDKTWDFTNSRNVGAALALADDAGAGGGGTAELAGTAAQTFANSGTVKTPSFLSATAAQAFTNSASLRSVARLTGTSAPVFANSAALTTKAKLSGSSTVAFTSAAALFARASLSGSALVDLTLSGTAFGRAFLGGTAAQLFANTAGLSVGAGITGSVTVAFANSASLFGRANLTGSASAVFALSGDLTAFAAGQITGTAAQAFTNSASLKTRAFLDGSASTAFMLSGSMSVGAAPIAGTATLAFINGAELRAIAPLSGASALAFTGSAALEATSYLTGTAAQQFTVSADLSGAPAAVVETAPTGAGRSRRRRRYFIEVDGQPIFVEGEAEAQALLDELAVEAERKVERAEKRAIVRARVTGKAPKITRPRSVPKVEVPRELAKAIGNPVEERIRAAMRDAEIRAYLEWQAELDDEEALLALVA